MARVKGRDVLLDLIDTVHRLEKTSQEQAAQLAAVAVQAAATSARGEQLVHAVESLDEDLRTQAELLVAATATARTQHQQVGQLSRLLSTFAEGSRDRFGEIEARLDALERKAG